MNDISNIDDSGQLTLFTATEDSVEDLIYEFLKDRGASTERAYHRGSQFELPKVEGDKMRFETIRRVHIIKYKKYLEVTPSCRKKAFAPNTINRKLSAVSSFFNFYCKEKLTDKF